MFPAGSGQPPIFIGLTQSCDTDGGIISFDCNKAISGSFCSITLVSKVDQRSYGASYIDQNVNSRSFSFKRVPNGEYILNADNGEADIEKNITISCTVATSVFDIISIDGGNASSVNAKDATAIALIKANAGTSVQTHLGDFVYVNAVETSAGNFKATYTNLGSGLHTLYAKNSTGTIKQQTFNTTYTKILGCTNPLASNYNPLATDDDGTCVIPPPIKKNIFAVPLMNPLRFVQRVDLFSTAPTLDNRRYNNEENWSGISRSIYYQKVNRNDLLSTQFRSNYGTNKCEIRDAQTDQIILEIEPELKQENIGLFKQYDGWLTQDPGNLSGSRLYFNGGELPLAFVNGDRIDIINALPLSINKQYMVTGTSYNAAESIPYIVISLPYPVTTPPTNRINVNVKTDYDILPYNVYEFSPIWGNIPNGIYYCKVYGSNVKGGTPEVEYNSELFALYPDHPNTNLISYRNLDDTLDLCFTTGFICNIRVESEAWQRVPAGTRKTDRKPNGGLRKLSSLAIRKFKFNTFKLPPWLHEKLAFIFDLDYVAINGVEVQSEDGYSEPAYVTRYGLSNSTILLEQVEPFTDQNGTDLGDVTASGRFVLVNDRFLKL